MSEKRRLSAGQGVCIVGSGSAHGHNRMRYPKREKINENRSRGVRKRFVSAPSTFGLVDCLLLVIPFLIEIILIR